MARERSDDIENAFEEAWDQAATASDYQHIELLLLADYGRRTLVLNPNDASHSSIRWPERVHLGWLRSGLAGAYQDERLLPRLYESIAKPTGMSLGYHGLGAVSLMPTLMAGGSRRWEQAAVCSVPPRKLAHFRPSSRNHLNVLMRTYPFPTAPEQRRWTSWVSYYMRLWIFVLLVNAVSIVIKIAQDNRYPESFTHGAAATATGANLLVAAIARHEHFYQHRLPSGMRVATPITLMASPPRRKSIQLRRHPLWVRIKCLIVVHLLCDPSSEPVPSSLGRKNRSRRDIGVDAHATDAHHHHVPPTDSTMSPQQMGDHAPLRGVDSDRAGLDTDAYYCYHNCAPRISASELSACSNAGVLLPALHNPPTHLPLASPPPPPDHPI